MKIRFNSEFLYDIFLFIAVLLFMIETTSLSNFNDSLGHDILQLLALFFAVFYIWKRKYTVKELIRICILNLIGLLCFLSSGFTGMFMTMLAITLLPKGALDRVLKMILKEEVVLFFIIASLSLIGVLNNQTFGINKGTYTTNALSLGFGHPNMLAAQGTSIVLLYLCVNRRKLKRIHYFVTMLLVLTIYLISKGRTSLFLGVLAILLISFCKNNGVKKIIIKFMSYAYIAVLGILIVCMFAYAHYGDKASIVKLLNDSLFNGRMGLAYRSLLAYPITLFGKPIDTSIWNQYQYYSLDNGQVMVLLEYGVVGFLAYFAVIQATLRKIKIEQETVFGIVMIIFLIWSMYEGTMYFIGKNFAFLFLGTSDNLLSLYQKKKEDL